MLVLSLLALNEDIDPLGKPSETRNKVFSKVD
jgi:hypothetical protein